MCTIGTLGILGVLGILGILCHLRHLGILGIVGILGILGVAPTHPRTRERARAEGRRGFPLTREVTDRVHDAEIRPRPKGTRW